MTQLEPLQSLFKNRAFIVPDYQRGYAWEAEQRQDLLSDLEDLTHLAGGKFHYTGTVVLHRGAHDSVQISGAVYDVVDIVDGQQRLTTLVILLNAVVEALARLDDDAMETSEAQRSEYIERKSRQSSLVRLRLNGNTDLFFRDFIIGERSAPDPKVPAHNNLLAAKAEFEEYIESELRLRGSNSEKAQFLNEFAYRITNKLGFVLYEVEDEAEVGVMFEVMNARGRTLTDMEKVKNYLLYIGTRVSDDKIALVRLTNDVNGTWVQVLEAISAAGPSGNEDQFLRYHWAIYPGAGWFDDSRARTFDIHRAVKNTLTMRAKDKAKDDIYRGVIAYLSSLRSLAVSYRDVLNPTLQNAFSALPSARNIILDRAASLQRIGRSATVLPILMAAHNRFGNDATGLVELFRLAETLAFRLAAVGRRANAGDTYAYSIAAEIMLGMLSAAEAAERLKGLVNYYCSDYQLEATLLDPAMDAYRWTPLRYFLFEYERHLVENAKMKFTVDWTLFYRKDKDDTIEHILPQGDNTLTVAYWRDRFSQDAHIAYRNRLGNLCLTDWNTSYSNKPFPEKLGHATDPPEKRVYRNSRWLMERELTHTSEWLPETIEARQKTLAEFALKRWAV